MMLLFLLILLQTAPGGSHDVIVRESWHYTYTDAAKGRLIVKEHITVLNKDGRDFGRYVIHYGDFVTPRNIRSVVRDTSGRVLSRLSPRDISDMSGTTGTTLLSDTRVKVFEMIHDTYPYVVETEYQLEFDGMLGLPAWSPGHPRAKVERATYTIDLPSTVPIQFAVRNLDVDPSRETRGSRVVWSWDVNDLPAMEREPYAPPWAEVAPYLVVSARDFKISGRQGSLESWSSLGMWIHDLWEGRDALPAEEVDKVKAMIADATTTQEQVRRIYSYLQKNTRYVSIQLGIGGWQTEEAKNTVSTKYGDCKALTNYMMAMLRAVGIDAYPAMINLGIGVDVMADIPNNRFNHVVLFVPAGGDSLFLECTSKDYPMGYLGLQNAGKNTLIVRPEGGQLIKSPTLKGAQNRQSRTGSVVLDAGGNATVSVQTVYTGYAHEAIRGMDSGMTPREREEALRDGITVPRFELTHYAIRASPDSAVASLNLTLRLPTYANKAGQRLIFQPNILEQQRFSLNPMPDRRQPVRFLYTHTTSDELVISIPSGHRVESLPAAVELDRGFARFKSEVVMDGGRLVYRRELDIKEDTIPVETYEEFRQFVNTMLQADQSRIVLIRE